MSHALVPTLGVIAGRVHRLPMRVYFEDTDAGGVVYHAGYLRFAERARTEMVIALGWNNARLLRETSAHWAVRHLEIAYKAPARLDDIVLVETSLAQLGGASMVCAQHISRDGTALAHLKVNIVLVGDSRPQRFPSELRAALAPLLTPATET